MRIGTLFSMGFWLSILFVATLQASGPIDVKVTSDTREYCHFVEFPQGWSTPRLDERGLLLTYDNSKDYEFRVAGLLSTRFLVAGVVERRRTEMQTIETRYTTNKYEVDLSNPKATARPASDAAWESGTTITSSRKSVVNSTAVLTPDHRVDYRGLQFEKTGHFWVTPDYSATRLSPDQAWLVLQSITGPTDGSGPAWNFTLRSLLPYHGKVFWDVFNADTGKKALTVHGSYSMGSPDSYLGQTAWLTERYFIVPLGEHNERCLVCEFGSRPQKERGK